MAPPDLGGTATENHFIECEQGIRIGGMVTGNDPNASGGTYVHLPTVALPTDWGWMGTLPPNRIEIRVNLRGGNYVVWVRSYSPSSDEDGWYAGFDKADLRRFYTDPKLTWVWTRWHGTEDRLRFDNRPAGPQTVVLGPGESGLRCDRILVTSNLSMTPPP